MIAIIYLHEIYSTLLFHDGGPYHKETTQWTSFYMIGTSVMKELNFYTLNLILFPEEE